MIIRVHNINRVPYKDYATSTLNTKPRPLP